MSSTLENLCAKHKKLVKLAVYFGGSEDDVQDFYIKMHKYKEGCELNDAYIFYALRAVVFSNMEKIKLESIETIKNIPEPTKVDYTELIKEVEKVIGTFNWYDAKLFSLYKDSGMSIRKLSKETGISTTSIFQTIKFCKNEIRKKVKVERLG